MIGGKIEYGLECGFFKHRLNCLLITDPIFLDHLLRHKSLQYFQLSGIANKSSFPLERNILKLVFPQNVLLCHRQYSMATSMVQVPCTALFTVLAANVVTPLWVKTTCNALQLGGGVPAFLFALKVRAECTFH